MVDQAPAAKRDPGQGVGGQPVVVGAAGPQAPVAGPAPHPAPTTDGGRAPQEGPPPFDQWKMTSWHVLPSQERTRGFDEVVQGYREDEVLIEAERCLLCTHPTCISGCPSNNPIPTYIALVQAGRILEAAVSDYEKNSLAACTGRVCAWEVQCEGACVLNARGEGVRIGAIERYIADYALQRPAEFDALRQQRAAERGARASAYADPQLSPYAAALEAYGVRTVPPYGPNDAFPDFTPLEGHSVAVIGAGPAGLACADFLSRRGCAVTVFEAQGYAGGLLADGIPNFVLPEAVVKAEVDRLRRQGVHFTFHTLLGRDHTLDELRQQFEAVFLGLGAVKARRTGLPGEDAEGVWTAQEFLRRAKAALEGVDPSLTPPAVGKRVLIIGAGNTSVDAARTALRLGAEDVHIVYRRTRAESPSRDIEIEHAESEGVHFDYLVNPTAYLKDDAGRLRGVRLVRMRLGPPDPSGRPRPEVIPDSAFEMACDTVVLAVGYAVGGDVTGHPELLNRDGSVRIVDEWGATPMEGVFAGGDAVRGAFTVVHAVRDGRMAADGIGRWLRRKRSG